MLPSPYAEASLFVASGLALIALGAAVYFSRTLACTRHEMERLRQPPPPRPVDPAIEEQAARERAVLEGRWRRAEAQLDLTQRELAMLSYAVSHDLRAPLRGIDGFSQALVEDFGESLDPTATDYLRRVRVNAALLTSLMDDLLLLSRIARAEFRPQQVDLSAAAEEIAAALDKDEPGRRVRWDIQPDVAVQGDRALLGAALRHLLGNAWKFTAGQAAPSISFRALEADGQPGARVFEVRDNGMGFDMQYAGKLFGAFQCLHQRLDEQAGNGIGLAAVQRIVHRHGGRVWAEAAPDEGAAFFFTLPESAAVAEPPPPRRDLSVPAAAAAASSSALASFNL